MRRSVYPQSGVGECKNWGGRGDQVSRIEILELIVPQLEGNDNEEVILLTIGCWGGRWGMGTKSAQ